MRSKKGLSDIVTNVLIILLVLVAVSIIWLFLRPTIQGGAGALGGASDCLTVQVEPVTCAPTATDISVTVRRGAGTGALEDLKVIFDTAGVRTVVDASDLGAFELNELESTTYTFTDAGLLGADSVTVAAVVSDGSGGQKTCSESTVKATC